MCEDIDDEDLIDMEAEANTAPRFASQVQLTRYLYTQFQNTYLFYCFDGGTKQWGIVTCQQNMSAYGRSNFH